MISGGPHREVFYEAIQSPPYLLVYDEFNQLLGLMKGPFPIKLLETGYLNLVAETDDALVYERVTFEVTQWAKEDRGVIEQWYALRSRTNSISDLKMIKAFR